MPGLVTRVTRWVSAIILILIGLVLTLPGIPGPGLLIILIGVLVLLPESRWLRRKYAGVKRRYPRIFEPLERRRRRRREARRRRPR